VIEEIEDNKVFEAIQLMKKYVDDNGEFFGYDYNEAIWIKFFLNIVEQQKKDPNYLAIGHYTDGVLTGFLTASTFQNYYNNQWVMDVKDCIVDLENKNNSFIVFKLFDYMIEYIKEHNGKHWRADSVRGQEEALRYGKLLEKRYNAKVHTSIRGIIGENNVDNKEKE